MIFAIKRSGANLIPYSPGGYSSMIWVGTCRRDLKSRPIFIPNFAEKRDPFLYHEPQLLLSKIY